MNQQSNGLNQNIAEKGCKYLCHLKIASFETGQKMSVEKLNSLYENHIRKGYLKNKCDVIRPNEIMADFMATLGGISQCPRQLGRIHANGKGSTISFWGGVQTRPIKYFLVEYKTAIGYHWVLCDGMMNELYDPWRKDYRRVCINSINIIG